VQLSFRINPYRLIRNIAVRVKNKPAIVIFMAAAFKTAPGFGVRRLFIKTKVDLIKIHFTRLNLCFGHRRTRGFFYRREIILRNIHSGNERLRPVQINATQTGIYCTRGPAAGTYRVNRYSAGPFNRVSGREHPVFRSEAGNGIDGNITFFVKRKRLKTVA